LFRTLYASFSTFDLGSKWGSNYWTPVLESHSRLPSAAWHARRK